VTPFKNGNTLAMFYTDNRFDFQTYNSLLFTDISAIVKYDSSRPKHLMRSASRTFSSTYFIPSPLRDRGSSCHPHIQEQDFRPSTTEQLVVVFTEKGKSLFHGSS
jgi:hypothetical protein